MKIPLHRWADFTHGMMVTGIFWSIGAHEWMNLIVMCVFWAAMIFSLPRTDDHG